MAIAGEIEVKADGSVVVRNHATGMMTSYASMDAAMISRFDQGLRGLAEKMHDVGETADEVRGKIDEFSQPRTSYTDAEFAEKMQEAEAIGRAEGIKLGFQDAIDQVVEFLSDVAGDDGCIDPNKERVWTGLGGLKPLVEGDQTSD